MGGGPALGISLRPGDLGPQKRPFECWCLLAGPRSEAWAAPGTVCEGTRSMVEVATPVLTTWLLERFLEHFAGESWRVVQGELGKKTGGGTADLGRQGSRESGG